MRIGIREQLGILVLATSVVPLAILAIATWINNHNFVVDITSNSLTLTASLKASQIASDLTLIQSTCSTIVTRILMQEALRSFYRGNSTSNNWTTASNDVGGGLASGGLSALLQVIVFSRNGTGNPGGLFNVTDDTVEIQLPGTAPNGSAVFLGDPDLGYPAMLYPNISYTPTSTPDPADPSINGSIASAFADFPLNATSFLLLGPLQINESYALVSLTQPIVDNTDPAVVLGYMTVVAAASSLIDVTQSREGLGNTGIVLLVGPNRRENQFKYIDKPATANSSANLTNLETATVKYVFPPYSTTTQNRHSVYNANLSKYGTSNFTESAYPAVVAGFGTQNPVFNNASSMLTTHNENNVSVAVGYARPQSNLVDWLLIVEQSHDEAWKPINQLKTIVLSCVFGMIGFILIIVVPIAHYSVRPIRRLRDATEKSIAPPGYTPNGSIRSERMGDLSGDEAADEENGISTRSKRGLMVRLRNLRQTGRRKSKLEQTEDERRRAFKIPAEVPDRKHLVSDEISELTTTFNAMSRELLLQYTSLETKVQERTQELEISKQAAEAANESKTLFIANISHELKTPLNGILGMCAVCLGEEDPARIRKSLQVIYKSGDLLLHLLNDLLTFSKNQIGQQLTLEEKEFRLADVKSQITTIFEKQVREGHINFGVKFIGSDTDNETEDSIEKALPALGPQGMGRLKDMCLWGDQHRILQVIINLVSNSLKFTPEGGKVEVRIKCLGEADISDGSRNSMGSKPSKNSSQRTSRNRHRNGSGSNTSQVSRKPSSNGPKQQGTALLINPMDPKATPRVQVRERSPTPPPANARTLIFQFEVEDTGPGIPEHLQDRVFEPFVQGDLGLSKKYGGTGLGLSICSQLAGLMGGQISLVSTEGVGTTFTMQIPLKHTRDRAPSTSSSDAYGSRPPSEYNHTPSNEPDAGKSVDGPQDSSHRASLSQSNSMGFQKDPQPRLVGLSQPFFAAIPSPSTVKGPSEQLAALESVAAHDSNARLRVLVAEDNLVNQEVVLRMLKLEDIYDVVIAKDGQEAYDMVKESMAKNHFFDLIFMDIQMPNLDGLQSTRLIRQMGYSAPIVALTAFAEESNVKECYDSGMNHFLSKPIRRPALKQVLKKFATIPEEETETSSLTRKSSPEVDTAATTSTSDQTAAPQTSATPANGTTPSSPSQANGTGSSSS